jgi:hypothetical protein
MARVCNKCGKAFSDGDIHICDPIRDLQPGMALSGTCPDCHGTIDLSGRVIHVCKKKEGIKHDQGKPDHSLLPPDALVDIIRVYELGVRKYGRDNWRRGLAYSRIFGAIMRHLWAWWKGEEINKEDDNLSHLAQAAWGCLTLLEYTRTAKYGLFDDRPVLDTVPVDLPLSQEEPYDFKRTISAEKYPPEPPPPFRRDCPPDSHEWEYETSRGVTNGTITLWKCKKCDVKKETVEPPVSIPSCWSPDFNPMPYTITITSGARAGESYEVLPGGVLKALSKPEMPPNIKAGVHG